FINLLTNARDALADVEQKRIVIACSTIDDIVELIVRDNGCGIPAGFEERIFDPFFTTKQVGSGTGLGLSITYGIISDHHGTISVTSRAGEGAEFQIHLPLADSTPPLTAGSPS